MKKRKEYKLNTTIKIFISVLFVCFFLQFAKADEFHGFMKSVKTGNYEKAKHVLSGMATKRTNTYTFHFLSSFYYHLRNNPEFNPNQALKYIKTAKNTLLEDYEKLAKNGITMDSIKMYFIKIEAIAYNYYANNEDVENLRTFYKLAESQSLKIKSEKLWENIDFKICKRINTIDGYNEYIEKYSAADSIDRAYFYRDKLEFLQVQKKHNLKYFRNFLADKPKSYFRQDAFIILMQLEDSLLNANPSKENLSYYILNYPNGKHVIDAKQMLEDLDWREALTNPSKLSLRNYFLMYPESTHLEEGWKVLDSLCFAEANLEYLSNRRIEKLCAFIGTFSNSIYSDSAKHIRSKFYESYDIGTLLSKMFQSEIEVTERNAMASEYFDRIIRFGSGDSTIAFPNSLNSNIIEFIRLNEHYGNIYNFSLKEFIAFFANRETEKFSNKQRIIEYFQFILSKDDYKYRLTDEDYLDLFFMTADTCISKGDIESLSSLQLLMGEYKRDYLSKEIFSYIYSRFTGNGTNKKRLSILINRNDFYGKLANLDYYLAIQNKADFVSLGQYISDYPKSRYWDNAVQTMFCCCGKNNVEVTNYLRNYFRKHNMEDNHYTNLSCIRTSSGNCTSVSNIPSRSRHLVDYIRPNYGLTNRWITPQLRGSISVTILNKHEKYNILIQK